MSKYEKIALFFISVLVLAMIFFSYHELTEPKKNENIQGPTFEQSIGKGFKMGTFATVLDQQASGPVEKNCETLEPVIVATLHDIDTRLEQLGVYKRGVFEVNQQTLDLFCFQQASVTLSNNEGVKLLLTKRPFQREVLSGGGPDTVGTSVRIYATVISPGTLPPASPTTYGEELIPDIYLDSN